MMTPVPGSGKGEAILPQPYPGFFTILPQAGPCGALI